MLNAFAIGQNIHVYQEMRHIDANNCLTKSFRIRIVQQNVFISMASSMLFRSVYVYPFSDFFVCFY